jgi:tRNA(Ile)-lysidine synthase
MPPATLKSTSREKLDALAVNSSAGRRVFQPAELAALFAPFSNLITNQKTLAVAVSGGADSMALCLLVNEWAITAGHNIIALTVDHGLRAEAANEAQTVAGWLADKGISHHVLTWSGVKPATGIQAAAREARYRLMAAWCQENDIATLMTAHHLEDQVETFLLRAERGSGLDGLAAMSPLIERDGISLLRPLLGVSKTCLREWLNQNGQSWIEDPSNQNPAYRRTNLRRLVTDLESRGLPPQKLSVVVDQFAALRQIFTEIVTVFFERAVRFLPAGYGVVQLDVLQKLPAPILERVLVRLASVVGGKTYPPRLDRLKGAIEHIKADKISGFTLGGCRFFAKGNAIMICRDIRAISVTEVAAGDAFVWGGVFDIKITGPAEEKAQLAALGKKGWHEIVRDQPELRDSSVPYPVRLTLPTLSDETGVVAVPGLGYYRESQKNPNWAFCKLQYIASNN